MNAYSTLWHSYTDDHIGQLIADVISNLDNITLNTNTPTRHTGHRGQLNMHYHQTTYPSSPQFAYDMTIDYNKTNGHSPTTRKLTGHNSWKTTIPTNIHTANIIFTNIILMADKHNIPKGKMHSNCRILYENIVCKITQRNNIRRANTCDPFLKLLNEEITSDIQKHKQNLWKEHLDAHCDHRHNTHIIWKNIHGISNRTPPTTQTTPSHSTTK